MIKSFTILLSCLMLYSFPSLAQEPDQTVQLELDLDTDKTYAEVFALPDSSLILYTKTIDGWLTDATFGFAKYDHQLRKVWQTAQKIDAQSEYVQHYTELPFAYFIFDSNDEQEYYFVKINLATGESTLTEYEIPAIRSIEEFKVLGGNYFIISIDRKSDKPALYHLNPESGKISLLPSVYGDESFFADLLADSEQNRADAVLLESNGRVSHLQTKSFSPTGALIGTYFTPPQRNKLLQDAEVSPGDTLSKLLIGVYGNNGMNYSGGFFTMPLIHSNRDGHFYSILDLENSLSHLKQRQENRIRRREQKRIAEGREPRLRYNLLLHDLITTPDHHILATEVYTTQYDRNNIISKPYFGLPMKQGNEIYKHRQVMVVVFDKQGKLVWDNTFELDDIVTDQLVPTVEIAAAPDGRVIIALPDDDEIIYHIMEQDTYTKEKTRFEIKGPKEDDKISWTSDHGIISWYGANFAAFGYHRVRSAGGETRNVFYINKISF